MFATTISSAFFIKALFTVQVEMLSGTKYFWELNDELELDPTDNGKISQGLGSPSSNPAIRF